MTYKTHLIGGAQIGVLMAYAYQGTIIESSLLIGTAMLGSVLPDLDQPQSKLSRSDMLAGMISHAISTFTKHRGFTHTLPGAIVFATIAYGIAAFRTSIESVFALYCAALVFIVCHLVRGLPGKLGSLLAVAVYLFAPTIYDMAAAHDISLTFEPASAKLCAAGVFAGCLAHMIYDTFNPGGIKWLWPLSKSTIHIASIKTKSHKEIYFSVAQIVLLSVLIAVCGKDLYVMKLIEQVIDEFSVAIAYALSA